MDLFTKLEWPILLEKIAEFCQTESGTQVIHSLQPNLEKDQIHQTWDATYSLVPLIRQGNTPPIGDIHPIKNILRAAHLGQILSGQ